MTVPMVVITVILGLMSLMGAIIGFFCTRTLSKVDRNQERLFEKVDGLEKGLSYLQGQHEILACKKIN